MLVRVEPGELPTRRGKPETRTAPAKAPFLLPLTETPTYGATVSGARALVVTLVTLAATTAPAEGAAIEYDPLTTSRPETSAEKRATRPFAEAVLTAYRSGRFAPLCSLFSPAEVNASTAP